MSPALNLFAAYGVELEYMIVDAGTLAIRPITDQVLHQAAGETVSEVELGQLAWSNELARHVIELKTNGPAASLGPLAEVFQEHVGRIQALLQPLGARLMPTAMHPWMDPHRELEVWPHQHHPIYDAYHRIFDCRGHGWANLQSVHLNLPFADDDQFGRLHAAIRLLLPLLPALAASSPVADGRLTGWADYRLHVYRHNADRVPLVAGEVIPAPVYTAADYQRLILQPMYAGIAPFDPDGILCHPWLNARGAIARFDRNTIEIRVLDVQECPAADLAICQVIAAVLRALTEQRWTSTQQQQAFATAPLAEMLWATTRDADQAMISDRSYLAQFGVARACPARDVWHQLVQTLGQTAAPLDVILTDGPLTRRIRRAIGDDVRRLPSTYQQLCDCLTQGIMFQP